VALTTLGSLLLELSLTRIFSAVFHYHFAFLAISIALFGLGAGGLCAYVVPRQPWVRLFRTLGWTSVASAAAVVLALIHVLQVRQPEGAWVLASIYLLAALPFFFNGLILSSILAETVCRVDRVYFFDLLGAAGGCLLLVPLLDLVGGPATVLTVAVVLLSTAALWFTLARLPRWRVATVTLGLGLVGIIVINARKPFPILDLPAHGELQELFVKWNSYSRVALASDPEHRPVIRVDASGLYPIACWDPEQLTAEQRRRLFDTGPGLPYRLRPASRVLILGAGGGWDVLRAVAAGSPSVTAVEMNPIVARTIMMDRFAQLSHRLYLRPTVRVVVADGRSYLSRSQEQFDLIQATPATVQGSSPAGALALAENTLHTLEAFEEYWKHTSHRGLIAFSYWSSRQGQECRKLVATAARALRRNGVENPGSRILVLREQSWNGDQPAVLDTVVVSKMPLSTGDQWTVTEFLRQAPVSLLYAPWRASSDGRAPAFELSGETSAAGEPSVRPIEDNQPYLFSAFQAEAADAGWPVLLELLVLSLANVGVILCLPAVVARDRLPRGGRTFQWLCYFIFTGAGYVVLQVALITRMVLFLGQPTRALTVVVFSMLVASAAGSYTSRRLAGHSGQSLGGILGLAALLIAGLAVVASVLLPKGMGWAGWMRAATIVTLVAPPGYLLGMAFPAGMQRLAEIHPGALRWAWALNSSASVLGSVLAVALGMYLGLRETMLLAAVLYVAALLCATGYNHGLAGHRPSTGMEIAGCQKITRG